MEDGNSKKQNQSEIERFNMLNFLWSLFVFIMVWLAIGLVGSALNPAISFIVGFFVAVWAASKA
jgi:glycerol uptake facilitator-like aquaporin